MVLKRVAPLSLAKIFTAVYGSIGLIIGCIFALVSLLGAGIGAMNDAGSGMLGALFGIGAVVILPLFYGVVGFIVGLLGAALYNLFAAMVGGVELELE